MIWPMTVAMAAPAMPRRGKPKSPEYEDGVQNDIDNCSKPLGDHVVDSAAGGLDDPLQSDFQINAEGKDRTDGKVSSSLADDLRIVCLHRKIELRKENSEQGGNNITENENEYSVNCSQISPFLVLFS